MSKKLVILFRVLGILLMLLLILLIASYFLIQNPKVQTKLIHYYSQKLSKDWNTKVEIGDVAVDFFSSVNINNVYIEDQKGDTLFYASSMRTKASIFQPFKKNFSLHKTEFEDVKIQLKRTEKDSLFNFSFLLPTPDSEKKDSKQQDQKPTNLVLKNVSFTNLDFSLVDSLEKKITTIKAEELKTDFRNFKLSEKQIKAKYVTADQPIIELINMDDFDYEKRETNTFQTPEGWVIEVDKLDLMNGSFLKRGKPKKPGKENVFAFNYYHWDPFDLEAEHVILESGQLDLDINKLAFEDETGFIVHEFSAHGFINGQDVQLNDLKVLMNNSVLDGTITLNYNDFSHFKDFEEKIGLNADVNQIKLMPREFQLLFGSDILKEAITISGQLQGTVDNLSTQNFNLSYQNGTVIKGDIDARGLPVLQDTFFDAKIDELTISQYGLQEIMGKKQVPEQVKRFGNMSYEGDFVGYITDLIVYGDLQTDIGHFLLDIKYSDAANKQPEYSGYLASSDFQLGYWLDNKDFGDIDFSGSVRGQNFDLNSMNTSVDAFINSIEYKGKVIDNVDLVASLDNKVLTYDASIDDELFLGQLDGSLNYSEPVAINTIHANVVKGDLYQLGLRDTPFDVSGEYSATLTGNSVEQLQGVIDAKDAKVNTSGKEYDLGSLSLEIINEDGVQNVGLSSENASIQLSGDYNYTQLIPTVLNTVNEYYDFDQGWEDLENTVQSNQDIGFEVEIDPNDELIKLILPQIQINSGVNASGVLNPVTNEISILALADSLAYKNYEIIDWTLDAYGDGEVLYINSFQDDIINSGKRWLTDSELSIELSRGDIFADVRTFNENFLDAKLTSRIKRLDKDVFEVSILSSDLIVNGQQWQIEDDNSITLGGGTWIAENFTLKNDEQRIQIYNPVNQENTKLIADLEQIEIADINSLIGFTKKEFEGQINGSVLLLEEEEGLNLDVSLTIEDLLYNNDQVDVASVEGIYNIDQKVGSFDGIANDNDFQFVLQTDLDLNKEEDIVDINVEILKSSLSPFENIWAKSIENLDGYIAGDMQIIGGPEVFRLGGDIEVVEDIAFTLKFTQARYTLPVGQDIDIVEDGFLLNNLSLQDPNGSIASLNGKITHNDLKDYSLNISGAFENFLFLNTTSRDNEVFYGTAFGSGDISFAGPVNDALMQVNATSESNTQIYIDSGSSSNTSEYRFIRFKEPDIDTTQLELDPVNRSKLTMIFDLDILPNAQVNMSFDSEGYNTLTGNGEGDLIIDMDTEGLLLINGLYEVNQGAYQVNFRDIFERDFRLLPGSFIQWADDPIDARLNIAAQYQLQADVSALSSNANNIRNLNNATTNLNVDITGRISEPEFTYNIELEEAQIGSEINDQINIINEDPTLLDNQIGSLLLLGQFSNLNSNPFSDLRGETIAIRSVTNILTSRLSGLLTEAGILENTTIGVDYENYRELAQQGLDGLPYDQQLQLQLRSKFFNDRIEVEYGGDFNFGDGLDDNINAFEVGDFVLTYRLSNSGNYKFKLFSTRDFSIIQQQEQRRNGFGFVIEKEFNTFKEAFEKEQPTEENQEELPFELQPAIEPEDESSEPEEEQKPPTPVKDHPTSDGALKEE